MGGQHHTVAALTQGQNQNHLLETGWAPGPVCMGVENLIPPLGFDSQTALPIASRYTVLYQRIIKNSKI
jgi:hypothetical protein